MAKTTQFQCSFKNKVRTVDTYAEAMSLRAAWGAGHARRQVERFFKVTEI